MEIRYEDNQFVAVDGEGVVVASSKNRDYLKRKIQSLAATLPTIKKAVEEFQINDRFDFTEQLQRDPFTPTMYEYVLMAATTGTNIDVYASINWQEVT